MRVLVIGAGVVGLSCAVRLREAGYDAHVLARDLAPETTSAVAAALWYPYRALPRDKVTGWSRTTYQELAQIAAQDVDAGVVMRWGTELLRSPEDQPWWRSALPEPASFEVLAAAPHGYAGAWHVEVPVADTSLYLMWLVRRVESSGGTITRSWLPALPERAIVVNCAGLAAGSLTGDRSVRPVRGQVVYLEQIGLSEWWLEQGDDSELTYIVPRSRDIVVGGTAEEDSFDLRPDARTTEAIVRRAAKLVPMLAKTSVLTERVGLRPVRPSVRLESERRPGGGVVHCYGHGGAGITLSWGCAREVVSKVAELAGEPTS